MQSQDFEDQLQFIEQFADTLANTFKGFAQICRNSMKKVQNNRPEYSQLQNQLIQERKKRMELQDKIREKINGKGKESFGIAADERKRPKTPYSLFLVNYLESTLNKCPDVDLEKINKLAAYKWKNMPEETKKNWERSLEEMNKIYEEQDREKIKNGDSNENPIKKEDQEYHEQNEEPNEEPNEPNEEPIEEPKQKIDEEHPQEGEMQVENPQEVGQTLIMQNDQQNLATIPVELPPIEKMLDLFHTPLNNQQSNVQKEAIIENGDGPHENKENDLKEPNIEQPLQQSEPNNEKELQIEEKEQKVDENKEEPKPQQIMEEEAKPEENSETKEQKVQKTQVPFFDPSIQIIEQIVIDPTLQAEK